MRAGFTLVELLVTVSIVAILATILLGALYTAQEKARIQKTRTTITKLHTMMMARYESYKHRRLPIKLPLNVQPFDAARMRLTALRQLMCWEMPDRDSDIPAPSVTSVSFSFTYTDTLGATQNYTMIVPRPSIARSYARHWEATRASDAAKGSILHGAEALYLILTTSVTDDESGREVFGNSEIGDMDGDGRLEFRDAWGNAISFIRWAPGFDSELQGQMGIVESGSTNTFTAQEGLSTEDGYYNQRFVTFISGALAGNQVRVTGGYTATTRQFIVSPSLSTAPQAGDRFIITRSPSEQDPFDWFRVQPGTCQLVPLILSPGPDGDYEIDSTPDHQFVAATNSIIDAFELPFGYWTDQNGDGVNGSLDNIHNHLIGTR